MHNEWDRQHYQKKQPKLPLFQTIMEKLEQPPFRRTTVMAVVSILVVIGVLGIVLSTQPGGQTLQGTADSWRNGLSFGVFLIASLILIWMFVKDKK